MRKPLPSSTAADLLAIVAQRTVPQLVTFALIILAYMPGLIPTLGTVMPPLPLMAVFYWAIHRPDWFGVASAFATGLIIDLIIGAPLGVSAGLYGIVHLLLVRQRPYFRSAMFLQLWVSYAAVQLAVTFLQSLLWWALGGVTPPMLSLLGMNILGLGVFPVIVALLSRLHKGLAGR